MNVKEFLEKEATKFPDTTREMISTKALGEFMFKAWRENLDRGTYIESHLKTLGYKPYNELGAMKHTPNWGMARAEVCIEIAIACLGEKEIEKRINDFYEN